MEVPGFNSGMRVIRTSLVKRYLPLLPNGFSFATTITVRFSRDGYRVGFVPVDHSPRIGRSTIRPLRHTINFFHLLLRTGAYFAPIRVSAPIAFGLFGFFLVSPGYDVFWLRNLTGKTLMLLPFSLNTLLFTLLPDIIRKASTDG